MRLLTAIYVIFILLISISSFGQEAEELVLLVDKTSNYQEKAALYQKIANKYQLSGSHQKAIEYFDKFYELTKGKLTLKQKEDHYQQQSSSYFAIREYKQCDKVLRKLLELNTTNGDIIKTKQTLVQLINVNKLDTNYNEAISFCQKLLVINRSQNDYRGMFVNYNNLGILYKKIDDSIESKRFLSKALDIMDKMDSSPEYEEANATLFLNLAADYTQSRDYEMARRFYKKAFDIYKGKNKTKELALIQNYWSLNEFLDGKVSEAYEFVRNAINIGEKDSHEDVLINSYKIISDISLSEKKLKDFVVWNTKYTFLKEKIDRNYLKLEQDLLQKQLDAEKRESKLRLLEVEQEKQLLTLKQVKLEKEKQEKEIELLKQLQALQESKMNKELLERQRIEQLLSLAEQRNLTVRQQSQIAELQKNKHLQELQLLQSTLIEKENLKKVELLKKDKRIRDSALQAVKNERNLLIIIIVSTLGLALMLIFFLYHNRIITKKLKAKNKEIEIKGNEIITQNEELQQRQEEILAQRDLIEQKNKILIFKNNEIEQQTEELKLMNEKISEINLYLERLVEEKTIKLQSTNKELDTLLYRTSHDFRRPLTSIMGLVELAKISMKEKENMWIIDKLNQVCIEQDKMLEKIKVLSEIERFVDDEQDIELEEIVKRILFEFKSQVSSLKIDVQLVAKIDEPIYLSGVLVGIILKYLIENSIAFCNHRNPQIKIDISMYNNVLYLILADNGQGIPEAYQPKVYDMYYRANENSKGNGLGLYVVNKAVEKLNGNIIFSSIVAVGTTFRVAIPLKK